MNASALLLLLILVAAITSGCAGRLESTVRKQAARDFQCEAESVKVEPRDYHGMSGTYSARGCGQESEYYGQCALVGICSAAEPVAYASAPSASSDPSDPSASSDPYASSDPSASSEPFAGASTNEPVPSAPAGPSVVSVTLRNSCGENTKIFFGDKPKFGSGTYSSLGSNSRTSKSMSSGDMIWIVDDSQNGVASATISDSTREVEIAGNCDTLRAR